MDYFVSFKSLFMFDEIDSGNAKSAGGGTVPPKNLVSSQWIKTKCLFKIFPLVNSALKILICFPEISLMYFFTNLSKLQ